MSRAGMANIYRESPYEALHIYYFEGRVAPTGWRLKDFIGTWEEDGFSFLFFSKPAGAQVERLRRAFPGALLLDSFHMSYEQWQGAAITPLQIGRFTIRPPWGPAEDEGPDTEPPILLDPGVVFGTGTHATTRDCLEAVTCAVGRGACTSALDLGTGTGLLALAAVRCGCSRCLAVDLNELAARTAAANVRLNRMQDRILVIQGRAETLIDTPVDLLIANIHYEIMRQLIRARGFLRKRWFILSGLMRSEAKAVRDFLNTVPVRILQEWSGDGVWHTLLGVTDWVDADAMHKRHKEPS
jgi:ribosomal protein L11 methyltransferase